MDPTTLKAQAGRSGADWSLGTTMGKARCLCICCLLVSLANCEKPTTISNSPSPTASPKVSLRKVISGPNSEAGAATIDVCGLLKPNEIAAHLGYPIKEHSSSGRSNGSLQTSQCVYIADRPDRSVSLVVTQTDSTHGGKQSARDFWEKTFDRYREPGKKEEKEEATGRVFKPEDAETEEGRPPRRIEGLGEEAFWTAGSLYVLSKDAFIRLSVGGAEAEEIKLEHSKALAASILHRLQVGSAR